MILPVYDHRIIVVLGPENGKLQLVCTWFALKWADEQMCGGSWMDRWMDGWMDGMMNKWKYKSDTSK